MVDQVMFNTITLCSLIKKTCGRSIEVVVDSVIGNDLEALHSCIFIRDDEHSTLPKYLEASFRRFETLKKSGFAFSTKPIRYNYLADLVSREKR